MTALGVVADRFGIEWGLSDGRRAQSHIVGVALLLALTTIALGSLTATVGGIVEDQTTRVDATRVADDFEDAIRPVETTGPRYGSVSFAEGRLTSASREVRVLDSGGVRRTVRTDALVFEAGDRRVAAVAGAVIRGRPGAAWLERSPPITAGPEVLIVGVPRYGADRSVGATSGATVPIRTNVSHHRSDLGSGPFRVAVETSTPDALRRYGSTLNATTSVRDFDGDDATSVVFEFPGTRRGFLVVHDLRLEVGHAR